MTAISIAPFLTAVSACLARQGLAVRVRHSVFGTKTPTASYSTPTGVRVNAGSSAAKSLCALLSNRERFLLTVTP